MAAKIVVARRFQKQVSRVYEYLTAEFSSKTASHFILKIEQRIELIVKQPEIGKLSKKKRYIRSIVLTPHNRIFYRYTDNKIEILYLHDMRRIPAKVHID
jgi:plasmid stabilization system protein ParE